MINGLFLVIFVLSLLSLILISANSYLEENNTKKIKDENTKSIILRNIELMDFMFVLIIALSLINLNAGILILTIAVLVEIIMLINKMKIIKK